MKIHQRLLFAMLATGAIAANAHAATLLDTGTPNISGTQIITLDANDFAASEFHIAGNYTIDSISGYLIAGDTGNPGDTFTVALYQDNNGHIGTQLQSAQATYLADGWNGVSALHWNAGPGNYWVAFEVGAGDNYSNLLLPLLAPNAALATAFNSGSGYHTFTGFDYGVQVTGVEAVPLPAAAWLFVSGIGFIGGVAKRRKA